MSHDLVTQCRTGTRSMNITWEFIRNIESTESDSALTRSPGDSFTL